MIKKLIQEKKIISLLINKYKVNGHSYYYIQDDIRSIAEKNERLLGKIFEKSYNKNLGIDHGILSDPKIVLSKEFLFKFCSYKEVCEYLKKREEEGIFTSEQIDEYISYLFSKADLQVLTDLSYLLSYHGKAIINLVLKQKITKDDLNNLQIIVKNCKMFPPELVDLYISVCDSWELCNLTTAIHRFQFWTCGITRDEKSYVLKKVEDAEQKLAEITKQKEKEEVEKAKKKELSEEQKAKIAAKKAKDEQKRKKAIDKANEKECAEFERLQAYKENLSNALQEQINSL